MFLNLIISKLIIETDIEIMKSQSHRPELFLDLGHLKINLGGHGL